MSGMKYILGEIKKHAFIWYVFMKNSLIGQLEYRVNFFTGLSMEIGYLFVKLLYVIVVYRAGTSVNGMTPDEVLVFVGTYVIVTGFYVGLFALNNFALSDHIRTGTLDFYIVKPVSLQFMATLRKSDFSIFLTDTLAGVIMVAIGWSRLKIPLDILNLLGFCGYILSGIIVGYSLFLFPMLFSFWFVKSGSLAGVVDSFWDFNNVPMGVYNKLIQRLGVFVIPIFVVTNFPAMFVMGKLDPLYAIWGIVAPAVCFCITRLLWTVAVKRYSSASS
jgi:ABC-2 type transport system permease protein